MFIFRLPGSKAVWTSILAMFFLQSILTFDTADGRLFGTRFRILARVRKLFERIRIPFIEPPVVNLTMIGGQGSLTDQWPWMSSLQYFDQWDDSYFHVCGAALLNDQWLLTAAHCVDGSVQNDPGRGEAASYRVMLGGVNLYYPSNKTQFIGLRTIIKHPGWVADATNGFPNDIALLRLERPAALTLPNIGAIQLPSTTNANFRQQECWITGWGLTSDSAHHPPEHLQQGLTPVTDNAVCQRSMSFPVHPTNICVGGATMPRACEGDSGSPLACKDGSSWTLAGIGSWSSVNCGSFSVYTRTSQYLNWISSVVAT